MDARQAKPKMLPYNYDNEESYLGLPDINWFENCILQYIVGQDAQVRQIITAIYKSRKLNPPIKSNILIVGGSGTGKTATIEEIAKRANIPYTIEDATEYTKEGYVGSSVKKMMYNLIACANGDIQRAQKGIIVIDEIDKKVNKTKEEDVSGTDVLMSLLKIIEGTRMQLTYGSGEISFNTKNIIVICTGAFSGLEKIRDKRLGKNTIGFDTKSDSSKKSSKRNERFLKTDFVEYGMPEEFIGRFDTIVEMNKLDKQDLVNILKKSKLSILKQYGVALKKRKIKLQYTQFFLEKVADESLSLDTGARELKSTVNYVFENIMYEIFANPSITYRKCIVTAETVEDNTKYLLLP